MDILQDVGKATEKEFQDIYGEDNVVFLCTDITCKEKLEGEYLGSQNTLGV